MNLWPIYRLLLCLGIYFAGLSVAFGQIYIVRGDRRPRRPQENTWFHNTTTGTVANYANGKWKDIALYKVDSVCACANMALLKSAHELELGFKHGEVWNVSHRPYWCGEKLVQIHNQDGLLNFWDENRELAAQVDTRYIKAEIKRITFQGMDAFCVPQSLGDFRHPDWNYVHGWGILGSNARWLIEPKFDRAFEFQDGVAEVLYYGQKRKINEKGEFVE